ncbi:MAG: T9SS type A sorting domain-containing protein [Fluviicola sp.]
MKHFILMATCCAIPVLSFSQQNTVTTGGTATGSNGSVTYSIGQVDYSNANGTDGTVYEGLQQPYEFFDPDAALTELEWGASLYPNPTMDQVVLQLEKTPSGAMYHLYDLNGKLLTSDEIINTKTVVNTRKLAAGSYILEISAPSKQTSTIQIIKH